MTDDEVRILAERSLREALGPGFERAEVTSGLDHDGEPALFVVAVFKPGAGRAGGEASSRALGAVSDALLAAGERRFPYILHRYPNDPLPLDEEPRKRSSRG